MNYWIWLSQLPGVGPVLQKRLLEAFLTPEKIHNASLTDLIEIEGIGQNLAEKILGFQVNRIFSIEEKLVKLGIKIVTSQSDPDRYNEVFACKRSPVLFFYRGELPLERGLAIVGSRRCTEDAKRSAEEIAGIAVRSRITVISGLAKGVDSYAHTASIKNGGKTMAVLGCGVDVCYPPEHKSLYQRILEDGGAVLSAYPPGVRPHPKFFLERNAHISAWSTDVVVVQAATKSGALTTAAFALDQGRNLYVVPHSIYLPEAKGSNLLLEKGARPYLGPGSLTSTSVQSPGDRLGKIQSKSMPLFEFQANNGANTVQVGKSGEVESELQAANLKPNVQAHPQAPTDPLSAIEKKIISYLRRDGRSSVEQLAFALTLSEIELTPALIVLEINNFIKIRGTTVILVSGTM